jgi:DNA-binding NarL/FixJ family response regulator
MTRLATLTSREIEVLTLVALGLPDKEIGARLRISSRAVRAHVEKCRSRLGAENRSHAVALAVSLGFLEVGPRAD